MKDSFNFNNPFDATKLLLTSDMKTSLRTLKQYFFVDYNLMDLFIYEHYYKGLVSTSKQKSLEDIDQALDSIMKGDQINKIIKKERDYSLLTALGFFSSIYPSVSV